MYDASFVSDKTKTIVSAVLGCDPDQVETLNLHDHGMDSINFIHIVIALENEFQISFDTGDIAIDKFPSIQSFVDYVMEKTAKTG